MKNLPLSSSRI